MKSLKNLIAIVLLIMVTSCGTTAEFPVSNTVPAAEIKVKKKQDKNNNYTLHLTAKNLAEANRLNPPRNNYSVWMVLNTGEVKNLGQISNKNSKKATFKTTTPFDAYEVFITAENTGNLNTPEGLEISRTSFND